MSSESFRFFADGSLNGTSLVLPFIGTLKGDLFSKNLEEKDAVRIREKVSAWIPFAVSFEEEDLVADAAVLGKGRPYS